MPETQDPGPPPSTSDDFDERLEAQLKARAEKSREGDASGLGRAMRVGTELVAAVVVGGGIGWLIDKGLNTFPLAFIIMIFLGFAAGVRNMARALKEMNAESGDD